MLVVIITLALFISTAISAKAPNAVADEKNHQKQDQQNQNEDPVTESSNKDVQEGKLSAQLVAEEDYVIIGGERIYEKWEPTFPRDKKTLVMSFYADVVYPNIADRSDTSTVTFFERIKKFLRNYFFGHDKSTIETPEEQESKFWYILKSNEKFINELFDLMLPEEFEKIRMQLLEYDEKGKEILEINHRILQKCQDEIGLPYEYDDYRIRACFEKNVYREENQEYKKMENSYDRYCGELYKTLKQRYDDKVSSGHL